MNNVIRINKFASLTGNITRSRTVNTTRTLFSSVIIAI